MKRYSATVEVRRDGALGSFSDYDFIVLAPEGASREELAQAFLKKVYEQGLEPRFIKDIKETA